jgi:hypothetical protein
MTKESPQGSSKTQETPEKCKVSPKILCIKLENVQVSDLGQAKKITVDKDNCSAS